LIFANLVDFDAKYGHRRDPEGMAQNIEHFDDRLPELLDALTAEDLMVITADHGNDPTFRGTDHTRERVPLLVVGSEPSELGVREGFSDVGASVSAWLGVEKGGLPGRNFA
jgi:phosphopentomutase